MFVIVSQKRRKYTSTGTPPTSPPRKVERHREMDYNALDYEDIQSDEDVPRKNVPSLVQYPLPGSYREFKGLLFFNQLNYILWVFKF